MGLKRTTLFYCASYLSFLILQTLCMCLKRPNENFEKLKIKLAAIVTTNATPVSSLELV